ncbi:MAG: PEP-CTERM sorting domain-containing protein [Desulfobacterales bacterium]|nr:PEP-CTERM sorting domain-containing protein [Desulfobacterales bacterium]
MKKLAVFLTTLLAAALVAGSAALAAFIDFETVPGGWPSDKLAITGQYEATHGVTFSLSNRGGNPYLEKTGDADSGTGFLNDALSQYDVAAPGYEPLLGDYFLRLGTGGLLSVPVPRLIIGYTDPVSGASAQIWDIDGHSNGTEQWRVQTFDSSDILTGDIYSPAGTTHGAGSLDGLPWTWSFSHASADISRIEISFTGSKTSGIGLAFDNFNTSSAAPVPEPATLLLLGMGLAGLRFTHRRKKKAAVHGL